ncbi:phytosulfokines 1 [Brachypodium distachyon]|uniref:Phytosulfokine-beta n=1 Tax=Brachypodium distachyon TaxID=15368 RepID=A0A0Q3JIU7_BRADI|nr:phytosulfokines 1 [Brachypodium distachyon]KQK17595.1 hypothetical protein BRADI_1g35560v3 [Brachypodium distachyon]|eukprot:XP_003560560.2 phytosulfokines 1 [Brachypodium distachyon]
MVNARKTAMAICLALLLLLVLVQDVHARKLPCELQKKHTAAPGPCSENGGHAGGAKQRQSQQLQRDPTKWEEIHTDYIYTQDVKHP